MPSKTLLEGPDGWWLAPEGAAIHLVEKTAVIADVHLGYEWARGRSGDCVPAHSLAETIAQLETLLDHTRIETLVVAGDLVESRRFCRQTLLDLDNLRGWLKNRGTNLVALAGNHDPPTRPLSPASLELAGWTIAHGHRKLIGKRTISGHHHPSLRAEGINAPCFLVGPHKIILPAFTKNAAGSGLEAIRELLGSPEEAIHCIATAGSELLDFGPAIALIQALK